MWDKKPLLSILIPTYNRKESLQKCIEYFIEEAYSLNIPVIVVDNHSNDNTKKYLKEISKRFSNIYYKIQNKNKWIDMNILEVTKLCKTQYWWWLWDDDGIIPWNLKKILTLLNKNKYDLILLNATLQNGKKLLNLEQNKYITNIKIFFILYIFKMPFGNIIINKDVVINIDYKKYVWDWHLYLWIILEYLNKKYSNNYNNASILIYKKSCVIRDKFTNIKSYSKSVVKVYLYDIPLWKKKIPILFRNLLKDIIWPHTISIKNFLLLKTQNNYKLKYSYVWFSNYKVHTKNEPLITKLNYIIVCFIPYFFLRILYFFYRKFNLKTFY